MVNKPDLMGNQVSPPESPETLHLPAASLDCNKGVEDNATAYHGEGCNVTDKVEGSTTSGFDVPEKLSGIGLNGESGVVEFPKDSLEMKNLEVPCQEEYLVHEDETSKREFSNQHQTGTECAHEIREEIIYNEIKSDENCDSIVIQSVGTPDHCRHSKQGRDSEEGEVFDSAPRSKLRTRPCKFDRTGYCYWGNYCRFRHLSENDRENYMFPPEPMYPPHPFEYWPPDMIAGPPMAEMVEAGFYGMDFYALAGTPSVELPSQSRGRTRNTRKETDSAKNENESLYRKDFMYHRYDVRGSSYQKGDSHDHIKKRDKDHKSEKNPRKSRSSVERDEHDRHFRDEVDQNKERSRSEQRDPGRRSKCRKATKNRSRSRVSGSKSPRQLKEKVSHERRKALHHERRHSTSPSMLLRASMLQALLPSISLPYSMRSSESSVSCGEESDLCGSGAGEHEASRRKSRRTDRDHRKSRRGNEETRGSTKLSLERDESKKLGDDRNSVRTRCEELFDAWWASKLRDPGSSSERSKVRHSNRKRSRLRSAKHRRRRSPSHSRCNFSPNRHSASKLRYPLSPVNPCSRRSCSGSSCDENYKCEDKRRRNSTYKSSSSKKSTRTRNERLDSSLKPKPRSRSTSKSCSSRSYPSDSRSTSVGSRYGTRTRPFRHPSRTRSRESSLSSVSSDRRTKEKRCKTPEYSTRHGKRNLGRKRLGDGRRRSKPRNSRRSRSRRYRMSQSNASYRSSSRSRRSPHKKTRYSRKSSPKSRSRASTHKRSSGYARSRSTSHRRSRSSSSRSRRLGVSHVSFDSSTSYSSSGTEIRSSSRRARRVVEKARNSRIRSTSLNRASGLPNWDLQNNQVGSSENVEAVQGLSKQISSGSRLSEPSGSEKPSTSTVKMWYL